MTSVPAIIDPFGSALRYVTDPYIRGAATQALMIGPATAGLSNVLGYSFEVFQARYGVQTSELDVSYVVTLSAPLGDGPVTLEMGYVNNNGASAAPVFIPAGTLPGTSFAVPVPHDGGLVVLQTLRERPAPGPGAPAGPDKWGLTALLGNTARLLWLLLAERQVLAAEARDVLAQHHLLTARGASLDHIGEALGVPRLLPAPYRLDLDPDVLALYHLDDLIAPVLDATHDHPGVNHSANRGVTGRIGAAVEITPAGGITIPDAAAFTIDAGGSFTVEMVAQLRALEDGMTAILAVKRAYADRTDGPGWSLSVESQTAETATLRFSLTDRTGQVVEAVTLEPVGLSNWFHIAGVLDGTQQVVKIFLNGTIVASTSFTILDAIENCADIGLGADRTGAALMAGFMDEVRISNAARSDFSTVLGGQPYAIDEATIALYHLDETDDWIDEDRGVHYAVNHGATRGVPARFDTGVRFTGDPLPQARCSAEREFQRRLKNGLWDRTQGGAPVTTGPYARYGYRQGAILLPGLDNTPQPVLVNDELGIDPRARGLVTTACYGFVPVDLDQTIAAFQQIGRSAQEAIDYYGDWHGEPESFFAQQYQAHGINAQHESCLPAPGTPTWIQVPGAQDLMLDENTNFTVEAIIKPDPLVDDYPRVVAASRSSALREDEPNANEAGWALSIASYNCIPNNLHWTVGDAAGHLVTVSTGFSLADGAFHHVAGVLDRDAGAALLFVDGTEVGKEPIGGLGAAVGTGDLILGNTPALDAPYAGLLDEVRLSRIARRRFHPVLGESDERYRQRLAIFQPYRLPSSVTLQRGVRALSLPVGATAAEVTEQATPLLLTYGLPSNLGQLDVLETDSTRFCATHRFRIVPARLLPSQSIASNGTTPADEAAATGDYTFHSEALVRQEDAPGLNFPTEAGRWMTLRAARALEILGVRLQAVSPQSQITIQSAWDPTQGGLHAQGRSLDVTLQNPAPGVDLGLLGALAHEIGVDYVAYEAFGGFLRLSFAADADLDLDAPEVASPGIPVAVVMRRPQLPNPGALTFRVLRCGPGDGTLSPDPQAGPTGRLFSGTALGEITIEVRYPLADGTFLVGARQLTIAPDTLGGCAVLGGDGGENVTEVEASGPPENDFQEAYLVRSDDPRLDYASEAARRMQLPLEQAVLKLADLAAADPGSPQVTILTAYDPVVPTLQAVGRGLVVAPSDAKMTAGRLGALAYRAGFSYIELRRYPPSVYTSVPAGERFEIVRSPLERLWPNARISGLGEFMATEFAAAGPPDANFDAGMLQTYTGAGVTFAQGVSNQVQATLAASLTALVAVLQNSGIAGDVLIIAGFSPAATDLTSVGRAVLLRHPVVTADRLAGYALQAGFAFVQHRPDALGGPAVYAAAYPASGPPPTIFTDDDLVLNTLSELHIRPELPITGSLDWCVTPCCPAAASLTTALTDPGSSTTYVRKVLRGIANGVITINASFSLRDAAEPYQFILVPRSMEEGEEPRLTKDQYDDLLNFVDAYCPTGVEAVTRGIRRFVHGFRRPLGWDHMPTSATFPRYRANR